MADEPHPQYEVTNQSVAMEPDGHGNFVKTVTVHYRSPEGTESFVKLHHHHYTARNAHDMIADELRTIQAVHALGQGPPPPHDTP